MAADNVVANAGSGGATFRTFSDGANEWPASAVCFVTGGSAGAWTLSQADTNSGNKSAATLRVVIATDQPSLTNALTVSVAAGQTYPTDSDRTQSTGLTAAGAVAVATNGCGAASLVLSGNGAGLSFTIQGQDAAGNWQSVPALTPAGALVAPGAALTANGQWIVPAAGWAQLRANLTAITGGTATFSWEASAGTQAVSLANPLPAGSNVVGAVTQSGAWTVTANAGTNLNTSALALDTSVNGLLVAQGSTTSGEKGPLIQGAVTTSAPAYTTAQTSPLSLTTGGALRVDASAGGTVAVSGTVTANQGGAPWSENVAQFGGNAIATGTGAGGNGVPRVTVSNDSAVKVWDGTTVAPVDSVGGLKNTPVPTSNQTGPTMQRVKAAASTNATGVKASAGQIYGWSLYNNASSARYFKLYNKASAPTVGTDTPFFTVIIPASGGTNVEWPHGIPMGTGIAFAITGGVADSDTTAVSADDVHGALLYK